MPPTGPCPAAGRRRAAARAGHVGDETSARSAAADADPKVRATALGALARLEALSIAQLAAGLADTDGGVRRRAAELAASFTDPDLDLVPLLDDGETAVAEAAAWALGERGDPGSVPPLAGMARAHDDPLCREAAVAALGAIGDPQGLEAILAALGDRAAVRRRAVIALAPFAGPAVDAALVRSLEDRDWQVRQAAEELLEPPP